MLFDLGSALAPSWAPLLVAVVMLLALGLLWWSMSRHLKRAAEYERRAETEAEASEQSG